MPLPPRRRRPPASTRGPHPTLLRSTAPARCHPCSEWRARSCPPLDRKSTRLNSSHRCISYAVFCLKKKKGLGGDEDAGLGRHGAVEEAADDRPTLHLLHRAAAAPAH